MSNTYSLRFLRLLTDTDVEVLININHIAYMQNLDDNKSDICMINGRVYSGEIQCTQELSNIIDNINTVRRRNK